MKNMGLRDLMLVNPRYFPHEDATARASGAEDILDLTRVVDSLDKALADCVYAAGASARSRAIDWPCMEPRECAARLSKESAAGNVAIVFGPEKSGLTNADLDRCNTLLTIPTNPAFSSLNIAMAVQIMCYELHLLRHTTPESREPDVSAATGEDIEHFYEHLETVLADSGFLNPQEPRLLMRRLRRLFAKADLDKNEVNILRGILAALQPGENQGNDK
jgi:TrmH family RNA methyltransferase